MILYLIHTFIFRFTFQVILKWRTTVGRMLLVFQMIKIMPLAVIMSTMQCVMCGIFPAALAEIRATLEKADCPLEDKEDMEYVTTQAAQNIESWKTHILRSINQDVARHDILKTWLSLCPHRFGLGNEIYSS